MRKAVYVVRNADFGLRKQILDCESRFWTAKGGFWSAKTGIGVRKRFLRQAGEFFLLAPRAGEFFSPEIAAGIFFCEVFLPPPPPPNKNQMVAPQVKPTSAPLLQDGDCPSTCVYPIQYCKCGYYHSPLCKWIQHQHHCSNMAAVRPRVCILSSTISMLITFSLYVSESNISTTAPRWRLYVHVCVSYPVL